MRGAEAEGMVCDEIKGRNVGFDGNFKALVREDDEEGCLKEGRVMDRFDDLLKIGFRRIKLFVSQVLMLNFWRFFDF